MSASRPLAALAAAAALMVPVGLVSAPTQAASTYDPKPASPGLPGCRTRSPTTWCTTTSSSSTTSASPSTSPSASTPPARRPTRRQGDHQGRREERRLLHRRRAQDVYAGATAKAPCSPSTQDKNPRAFGGVDLVSQLEGRVATAAPITGRIQDAYDPSSEFGGDFANVIGQAYAAQALSSAVSSPRASSVVAFLLQQQCDDGYFRLVLHRRQDRRRPVVPAARRRPQRAARHRRHGASPCSPCSDVKGAQGQGARSRRPSRGSWRQQLMTVRSAAGKSTETPTPTAPAWPAGRSARPAPPSRRPARPPGCAPCRSMASTRAPARLTKALGGHRLRLRRLRRRRGARGSRRRPATSGDGPRHRRCRCCAGRRAPRQAFTATGPATAAAGSVVTIRLTGVAPGQRVCVLDGGKVVRVRPGPRRRRQGHFRVAPAAGTSASTRCGVGSQRRDVTIRVTG